MTEEHTHQLIRVRVGKATTVEGGEFVPGLQYTAGEDYVYWKRSETEAVQEPEIQWETSYFECELCGEVVPQPENYNGTVEDDG
jgi:hypothetical protein